MICPSCGKQKLTAATTMCTETARNQHLYFCMCVTIDNGGEQMARTNLKAARKWCITIELIRGTWVGVVTLGRESRCTVTADDLHTLLDMAEEGFKMAMEWPDNLTAEEKDNAADILLSPIAARGGTGK